MSRFVDQEFVTGRAVAAQPKLVGLSTAQTEQGGLFAEKLGHGRFQAIDCRVFANHVVAKFGGDHRLVHPRGWLGHGIASQINDVRHGEYFKKKTLSGGFAEKSCAGRGKLGTGKNEGTGWGCEFSPRTANYDGGQGTLKS